MNFQPVWWRYTGFESKGLGANGKIPSSRAIMGVKMKNFGNELIKFSRIMKKTKKDCTLMVRSREGIGHIFFKDGQLLNAKTDKVNGKEAILEILAFV